MLHVACSCVFACVCVCVCAEVIDLCHNICPNKIHCNLFRWQKPCAIARVQRPGLPLCQVSKQVSSHNDGQQINLATCACVCVWASVWFTNCAKLISTARPTSHIRRCECIKTYLYTASRVCLNILMKALFTQTAIINFCLHWPYYSWLIWLPIAGALCLPTRQQFDRNLYLNSSWLHRIRISFRRHISWAVLMFGLMFEWERVRNFLSESLISLSLELTALDQNTV